MSWMLRQVWMIAHGVSLLVGLWEMSRADRRLRHRRREVTDEIESAFGGEP